MPACAAFGYAAVCLLLQLCLPRLDLTRLFIQPQIALIAGLFDLSCLYCLNHGTPRFCPMGAIVKLTGPNIPLKIRKGVLKIFLQNDLHLVCIEGGKTRCICNKGILIQSIQLHMPGGMSATPQLFRHFTGRQRKGRTQPVEHTALSHTGISGKSSQLSADQFPEGICSLSRLGAGTDHRETCMGIYTTKWGKS